ncbi:hypothetical protein FOZ62_023775, partial [Perkinsus olseni]
DGADDSTSALRAELEAAEEARNVGQVALTKLEADLADEKAKVAELREEQVSGTKETSLTGTGGCLVVRWFIDYRLKRAEAADRRWQEIQSEKQAKEAENEELKRTLKSMEKLPAELEAAKARRNEAEIAMFGLESEIDALKEQLEEKEKEIQKRVEAQAEKESANGDAGKPPLPPANTGKPSPGGNRRESREVRSRLSLEMDEAVAGLLGAAGATTAVSEEEQSVDKYKKIIVDLQEKIKVQDGWLDECEFDISKWEGRYRHEQEEHDETRRKYGEVAEALKRAEGKRAELKAEAQRLLLDAEWVTEEKQALEQAVKELDKAVAAEARKPETRTTATSTSMSMRSLVSYEQRFEAMKAETAKLKQDAEALEGSKRALELNAQKAEEKIDFMRSQKKELEGALGLLTDKLTVVDAERTRLLHALSLAQDELKALKTGIAGVSDYNAAIKEAMRDAQRSAHRRVSTVDEAAAGCKNTSRNDAAVGCKDTVREDASAGHENTSRDDVAANREDTSRNDAPPGAVTVANTGTFKSAHNFWAAKANTGPWEKRREKIPKSTEPVPARVLPRIEAASEAQEKQPPQASALSPLSVRMSEMGPVRNSPEEVDGDKENAPAQANPVEAKPLSRAEVKIKPLNPGETPSKIGRPRQPALMGDVSPSSASVPHRLISKRQAEAIRDGILGTPSLLEFSVGMLLVGHCGKSLSKLSFLLMLPPGVKAHSRCLALDLKLIECLWDADSPQGPESGLCQIVNEYVGPWRYEFKIESASFADCFNTIFERKSRLVGVDSYDLHYGKKLTVRPVVDPRPRRGEDPESPAKWPLLSAFGNRPTFDYDRVQDRLLCLGRDKAEEGVCLQTFTFGDEVPAALPINGLPKDAPLRCMKYVPAVDALVVAVMSDACTAARMYQIDISDSMTDSIDLLWVFDLPGRTAPRPFKLRPEVALNMCRSNRLQMVVAIIPPIEYRLVECKLSSGKTAFEPHRCKGGAVEGGSLHGLWVLGPNMILMTTGRPRQLHRVVRSSRERICDLDRKDSICHIIAGEDDRFHALWFHDNWLEMEMDDEDNHPADTYNLTTFRVTVSRYAEGPSVNPPELYPNYGRQYGGRFSRWSYDIDDHPSACFHVRKVDRNYLNRVGNISRGYMRLMKIFTLGHLAHAALTRTAGRGAAMKQHSGLRANKADEALRAAELGRPKVVGRVVSVKRSADETEYGRRV